MKGYNLIVVFNEASDRVLMCRRRKEPYKGLLNFVGGKIERNEEGIAAAYREFEEETAITKDDIILAHLMDFTYYHPEDCYLEVYVGRLNRQVTVTGDENELCWVVPEDNFYDESRYAGRGNLGYIMTQIENVRDKLLK